MKIKLFIFIFVSLFISSCGIKRPIFKEDNNLSKKLELPSIDNARPLLFIADNQLSNIYTDASLFGLRLSDMLSHVAIRPPALNLYSPFLTKSILNNYSNGRHVIHMGDALNISCKNEWNDFLSIMNGNHNKGWSWIMLPGNHDSNFYLISKNLPPNVTKPQFEVQCPRQRSADAQAKS